LRRLALALALCAPLAAGCGGDDEDGEGGRTATIPANAKIRVVAREYSFDPSTIVVEGAGTITVTLRNDGSLAHNLKLFRDDEELGGTATFPSGQSGSAPLDLEAGSYELICTVGDHADLGMTGTLRVN
jgi:plastocyanin